MILQAYSLGWSIEVYFKEIKQHLDDAQLNVRRFPGLPNYKLRVTTGFRQVIVGLGGFLSCVSSDSWTEYTVTGGHQPEIFVACQRWFKVASQPATQLAKVLAREYPGIRKISNRPPGTG